MDEFVDLSFPQQATCVFEPGLIGLGAQAEGGFRHRGQILAGMIPVNDLNSLREMTLNQFPDPDRPITDKDRSSYRSACR